MAQPVKKRKKIRTGREVFRYGFFFRENFTLFPGIFAEGLKSAAICVMIIGEEERRKKGTVGSV